MKMRLFSRRLKREAICVASFFCLVMMTPNNSLAKGVYQTGPDFIQEVFQQENDQAPAGKVLWLDAERKAVAAEILDHSFNAFRVRYWQQAGTTAWILEEIGKELPITIGVVVANNQIQQVKILTYRESRGGEVKYPAFLNQFNQASLHTDRQLTRKIDGITGATLSVRAVKNIARLALYFHQLVNQQ